MPPAIPRPGRRYVEIAVVLAALLAATVLTRCAPEPLPEPPVLAPAAISPRQEHRLEAMYDAAAARLTAYRALPPCAASGPLVCRDPIKAGAISGLALRARIALSRARQAAISVRLAKARMEAFEAATLKLPSGDKPNAITR
jgi:hypothetical protein